MFGWNLSRFIESEVKAGKERREANEMAVNRIGRLLEEKKIKPEEISLKEMAIAFCGYRWYESMNPTFGENDRDVRREMEATDAVDVTAFSNIIGQIVYTSIHKGWDDQAFIGEKLCRNVKTKLMSEKIPGFENIADEALKVQAGMPFPYVGFGESFQITPETSKYGLALALSKEAIFFDRTGQFLMNGEKLGKRLKIRKEKEILDVVIGARNNYFWRNLSLNTYRAAPLTPGLWVNQLSGNPLLSWKSLDASRQGFNQVRDPETGDPIVVGGMQILVPDQLLWTTRRILTAAQVREDVTGGVVKEYSPSPVDGMQIISSQLLHDRLIAPSDAATGRTQVEPDATKAAKYWFHGDFQNAFWYMENWGLEIMMNAGPQSEAEFERDIVWRSRASEMGVAAVYDPRYARRNYDN